MSMMKHNIWIVFTFMVVQMLFKWNSGSNWCSSPALQLFYTKFMTHRFYLNLFCLGRHKNDSGSQFWRKIFSVRALVKTFTQSVWMCSLFLCSIQSACNIGLNVKNNPAEWHTLDQCTVEQQKHWNISHYGTMALTRMALSRS